MVFPDARALVSSNRPLRLALAGSKQFVKRQPFVAKALPTSLGFAFGDLLTQYMNARGRGQPGGFRYEWRRGAKMAAAGCVLATPIGLGLLRALDTHAFAATPEGALALSVKFILDQVVGCALWQACYCAIYPPYAKALGELLASVNAGLQQSSQQAAQEVRLRVSRLQAATC